MALITCPECGKQVSDQAASCPSCGKPLKSKIVEQHLQAMAAEKDYRKYTLKTARKVLCILSVIFVVGYLGLAGAPELIINRWEVIMTLLAVSGIIIGFAKPNNGVAVLLAGVFDALAGIVGILCHGNVKETSAIAIWMIGVGIVFFVSYWRMKAYE